MNIRNCVVTLAVIVMSTVGAILLAFYGLLPLVNEGSVNVMFALIGLMLIIFGGALELLIRKF
jgi:hypothetical protein